MNSKDLSKAIEKARNNHTDWIFSQTMKAVAIVGAIIFLFIAVVFLNNLLYPSPQETGIADIGNCNYPYVICNVYMLEKFYKCQDGLVHEKVLYVDDGKNITSISNSSSNIFPCADISIQMPISKGNFCGYSEANAFFQQFKENHKELNLAMNCE